MALVFRKKYHGENKWEEITRDEAYQTLLTTWKDSDMTRDMLTIVNRIECRYSTVEVVYKREDGVVKTLIPGLRNLLPMGVEYGDDCNRIKKGGESLGCV